MPLVDTFRCLWSLFLSFFRSKPEKQMTSTVLPLSSEKTRQEPIQRRGSSLAASRGRSAGSYTSSKPHGLLPSKQSQGGFSMYSLILPDRHFRPPPRPPRPRSPVSEDEFNTPVMLPDVHLPSVIVTPCTPSKSSRTYAGISHLDELDSDESSSSDANSCMTSVDSNPFLSNPSSPLQKGIRLPPLGTRAHHRARSLTGTGRGLYHQRPSRSDCSFRGHQPLRFSSLPRVADAGMLANHVKKPGSVTSNTSSIRSSTRPAILDSTSQATTDRFRSYMKSADRHSEDPKGGITASGEAQPVVLANKYATVMDRIAPGVHGHVQLGIVPYAEVFDLDAYFDSDSSLRSESTLESSLNASSLTTDSTESKDPFLITPSSTSIFRSPPNPLHRISNISDTTASSTSIYTYSLSAVSTDSDGSPSPRSPRFGSLRIADIGSKSKVKFDHEVKRYRDHYRPPGYSRSPAFVIESPTTSKGFTGRRESDGISIKSANKENEMIGLAAASTSTLNRVELSDKDSMAPRIENPGCPSHVGDTSTNELPNDTRRAPQQEFQRSFRNPYSSTTTASIAKNIASRHRLGSVAISQRRKK